MTDATQAATDAARDSADAVSHLTAGFMLDLDTYAKAGEAGYQGLAFYFGGRAGVLGEATAEEVTEALAFFPAASVTTGWEQAGTVEPRAASAERFAATAARWAEAHLSEDGADYERLAELTGKVVAAADTIGAPIFAGWRDLPEPAGARQLAHHRLNALRELRFARHVDALRAAGIDPAIAFMVRSPMMADIFGVPEPRPVPRDTDKAQWEAAEADTDERFGRDLAALDADELTAFVELANAAHAAVV